MIIDFDNIPEIPDFKKYPNLLTAFKTTKMCLFIGAGVAQNLGMPSWITLSNQIINLCFSHNLVNHIEMETLKKDNNPIRSVSYCHYLIETNQNPKTNEYNNFFINEFLKKPMINYQSSEYKNGKEVYDILMDISEKALIIQTNYDQVLESITKRKYHHSCEFEKSSPPIMKIIYLHGRVEDKNNTYQDLVLTRSQYDELYIFETQKKLNHLSFLKRIFSDFTVLFLGYSLNDIEILQTISLANSYKDSVQEIYLLTAFSESQKVENKINYRYLKENFRITPIYFNIDRVGYSIFLEVLRALKDAIPDRIGMYDFLDNYLDSDYFKEKNNAKS